MMSVQNLVLPALTRRLRPYVLLVDDHGPSCRYLHDLIVLSGHTCVSSRSATDALSRCEAHRPQVVVTDLRMPNLDGRGLARWVRARYPSVPLILVTGEDLDDDAIALLKRTFTDIFFKPVDIESLLDRIDRLMPLEPGRPRP